MLCRRVLSAPLVKIASTVHQPNLLSKPKSLHKSSQSVNLLSTSYSVHSIHTSACSAFHPDMSSLSISPTSASSSSPSKSSAAISLLQSAYYGQGRIGVIGGGQMAAAMAQGLIQAGATKPEQLLVSDLDLTRMTDFKKLGCAITTDNVEVAKTCKVIILAVKPPIVPTVLAQVKNLLSDQHLIISVAAGVTVASMEEALGNKPVRVVRVMPNTPALVGQSASAFCLGTRATNDDATVVDYIFNSFGKAVKLSEYLIDAVTGLSGSGPAYVFMFIEALADGGVRAGLSRDVAMTLAIQTVQGAAQLVRDTGKHPGQLKDAVGSPGGTTMAGIHALETGAFRATVINAVVAATNRAKELGQTNKPGPSKL